MSTSQTPPPSEPKYPDISVVLSHDCDGNVFMVIAKVAKALRVGGVPQPIISEFAEDVIKSRNYDEALRTVMRWVEVE